MSDAAQTFNEAYQLIEQGDLASARQLLDEVRAENENNPDFWWLYAHAVEDAATGRDALNRVRQLRPDYPGLNNLLEQTETTTPSPIRPLRPPTTLPDMPNQTPDADFGDFDDDFETAEKPVGSNSRRNLYLAAAGTVIAIIVIAALLMFALPGSEDVPPTATTILVLPTTEAPFATVESIDVTEDIIEMTEEVEPTAEDIEPTAQIDTVDVTEEIEPIEEDATPTEEDVEPTEAETEIADTTEEVEPTENETVTEAVVEDVDYSAIAAQVSQFNVPDDGVEVTETMLGNTLLVTTCSPPGPTATQSILGILTVLQDEPVGDEIEAVGFRVANCTDDTTIRIIGVSREQFDDYVDGTTSAQQLQSSMRPIG